VARDKCIGIRQTLTPLLPKAEIERLAHESGPKQVPDSEGRRRPSSSAPCRLANRGSDHPIPQPSMRCAQPPIRSKPGQILLGHITPCSIGGFLSHQVLGMG